MPILPANTDFTDKDFASIQARAQALIQSVFPTWTDFNKTNFGNILVELYAWIADVLAFNQDANAQESRISTATQRRNLIALVKLLNYKPRGATAATVDESFVVPAGLSVNAIIPAGTVVKTESDQPVEFQLLSPLTLTPSQPNAIGTLENSKTQEETFAASGQPNQQLVAGQTPYLDDSSTVTDTSGGWTQVDNFLDSVSTDQHYTVSVDNNDRATVTFGDGTNGKLPSGTITWRYKTGGGAAGNVEAGSIKKIDATLVDLSSNTITVVATNAAASTGGTDRETLEHIRALAPQSIRAPRTTVAREDYEIHAIEVGGIERALMLTRNEDPTIPDNTGFLYPVPAGTGFPSAVLKQKVLDQCTVVFPNTLTFLLTVADPIYLDIGIAARVYFTKGNNTLAKQSAIKKVIIAGFQKYFALTQADGSINPLVDFGQNLANAAGNPSGNVPLSDLFDVVRDVPGIRKIGPLTTDFTVSAVRRFVTTPTGDVTVLTAGSHADIPIALRDFPRFDGDIGGMPNLVIIDADTNTTVP